MEQLMRFSELIQDSSISEKLQKLKKSLIKYHEIQAPEMIEAVHEHTQKLNELVQQSGSLEKIFGKTFNKPCRSFLFCILYRARFNSKFSNLL